MLGRYDAGMQLRVNGSFFLAADTRRQSSADLAEDQPQRPAGVNSINLTNTTS